MVDTNIRRPLAELLPELIAIAQELLEQIPALKALSLSPSSGKVGAASTVAIIGATAGSRLTMTPPDGLTFDSVNRRLVGTPTQAGVYEFAITETLSGATGSPRRSTVTFTVAERDPVAPSGVRWAGLARWASPAKWFNAAGEGGEITFGSQTVTFGDTGITFGGSSQSTTTFGSTTILFGNNQLTFGSN